MGCAGGPRRKSFHIKEIYFLGRALDNAGRDEYTMDMKQDMEALRKAEGFTLREWALLMAPGAGRITLEVIYAARKLKVKP